MPGHLIHIGYSKAGSTFLQDWFCRHPQLCYAPGGVGGMANVAGLSRLAAGNKLSTYSYFVTSDEALCRPTQTVGTMPVELGLGSFSAYRTEPYALQNSCQILSSLFPNARILFITRGFKSMILSGYSQYIKAGGIHEFGAFLEKARANPQFEEEYDYTSILEKFEATFGPENVLALPYELLRDDQDKFLSLIEGFLGIGHHPMPAKRINESLAATELYWYPRISGLVAKLAQKTGKRGYRKIYSWYIYQTYRNKLRRVVKIAEKVKPSPAVNKLVIPDEAVQVFRNANDRKYAARLRHNPLYQPYLTEYLLD